VLFGFTGTMSGALWVISIVADGSFSSHIFGKIGSGWKLARVSRIAPNAFTPRTAWPTMTEVPRQVALVLHLVAVADAEVQGRAAGVADVRFQELLHFRVRLEHGPGGRAHDGIGGRAAELGVRHRVVPAVDQIDNGDARLAPGVRAREDHGLPSIPAEVHRGGGVAVVFEGDRAVEDRLGGHPLPAPLDVRTMLLEDRRDGRVVAALRRKGLGLADLAETSATGEHRGGLDGILRLEVARLDRIHIFFGLEGRATLGRRKHERGQVAVVGDLGPFDPFALRREHAGEERQPKLLAGLKIAIDTEKFFGVVDSASDRHLFFLSLRSRSLGFVILVEADDDLRGRVCATESRDLLRVRVVARIPHEHVGVEVSTPDDLDGRVFAGPGSDRASRDADGSRGGLICRDDVAGAVHTDDFIEGDGLRSRKSHVLGEERRSIRQEKVALRERLEGVLCATGVSERNVSHGLVLSSV